MEKKNQPPPVNLYELHLYESVALGNGRHGNNPWLQELPDPISKVTWGNYAAVAPKLAEKLGLKNGDIVLLKTNSRSVKLPIFVQPRHESRPISITPAHDKPH